MWFRIGSFLSLVMAVVVVGCSSGPSDAEIAEMVRLEVERQVAEVEVPPGPVGPQGEPGPQGIPGESGVDTETRSYVDEALAVIRKDLVNLQVKTATDIQSLQSVPIRAVSTPEVEIPSVLEVEELIIRSKNSDYYMRLLPGGDGTVASIQWLFGVNGQVFSALSGGSVNGRVLSERNADSTWTSFCISEGTIGLCE